MLTTSGKCKNKFHQQNGKITKVPKHDVMVEMISAQLSESRENSSMVPSA